MARVRLVCLLCLCVALLNLPVPAQAISLIWGDAGILENGVFAAVFGQSGEQQSSDSGSDFLSDFGSTQVGVQDLFGDQSVAALSLASREVQMGALALVPQDPAHYGSATAVAYGGVYGAFGVTGGSGEVDIPVEFHAFYGGQGVFEVLSEVGIGFFDSNLNPLETMEGSFNGQDGVIDFSDEVTLDLQEGELYYYLLGGNVSSAAQSSELEAADVFGTPGNRYFDGQNLGIGTFDLRVGDSAQPIPEPASALLLAPGLAAIWMIRRRRNRLDPH